MQPFPVQATLASVAAHAQVSRQTVSNVLNAPDVVLPATRKRVQAAIEALDYRPNLAARRMRTSRSQALAVRIPSSEDGITATIMSRFVHALCSAAEDVAHHLVVFTAGDDAREIAMYQQLEMTVHIDGFVVVDTHARDDRVSWLSGREFPFVTFGRSWSDDVDHSWVDVDGGAGTYLATRHLIDRGHRDIAFLGWEGLSGMALDREQGWRRAMSEIAGSEEPVVLRGVDRVSTGAAMADDLASTHPGVTAAVCVTDSLAIGALQRSQFRRRPFEVFGFDDTITAQALGLSSVSQPIEEAARACLQLLMRQIQGGERIDVAHELLAPSLQVRSPESAGFGVGHA